LIGKKKSKEKIYRRKKIKEYLFDEKEFFEKKIYMFMCLFVIKKIN
jgi:hypothetical protein